jgi:hypothetical protein
VGPDEKLKHKLLCPTASQIRDSLTQRRTVFRILLFRRHMLGIRSCTAPRLLLLPRFSILPSLPDSCERKQLAVVHFKAVGLLGFSNPFPFVRIHLLLSGIFAASEDRETQA